MKGMMIEGNSKQILFSIMFLGDMLGDKKIAETSPEEVKKTLAMVFQNKKIDLA